MSDADNILDLSAVDVFHRQLLEELWGKPSRAMLLIYLENKCFPKPVSSFRR